MTVKQRSSIALPFSRKELEDSQYIDEVSKTTYYVLTFIITVKTEKSNAYNQYWTNQITKINDRIQDAISGTFFETTTVHPSFSLIKITVKSINVKCQHVEFIKNLWEIYLFVCQQNIIFNEIKNLTNSICSYYYYITRL